MSLQVTIVVSIIVGSLTFQSNQEVKRRDARKGTRQINEMGPRISSFEPSAKSLALCDRPFNPEVRMYCARNRRTTVTLQVTASDQTNDTLSYSYTTTTGEILGEGPRVTWNLEEAHQGTQKATVTVRNSRGGEATASTTVNVVLCNSCSFPDPPCPTFAINSREKEAHRGERVTFEVAVSTAAYFLDRPDYIWSVSGGKVIKGQHTPYVEVLVTGDIDKDVTATVEVAGFDSSCSRVSSYTLPIRP
jgi:hypothetical protein